MVKAKAGVYTPPLVEALHAASRTASAMLEAHLSHKITARQAICLTHIDANPGAHQQMLCDLTGMDRSSMSAMLTIMQFEGLVTRYRNPEDYRTMRIAIQAKGTRLLPLIREAQRKTVNELQTRSGGTILGLLDTLQLLTRPE